MPESKELLETSKPNAPKKIDVKKQNQMNVSKRLRESAGEAEKIKKSRHNSR